MPPSNEPCRPLPWPPHVIIIPWHKRSACDKICMDIVVHSCQVFPSLESVVVMIQIINRTWPSTNTNKIKRKVLKIICRRRHVFGCVFVWEIWSRTTYQHNKKPTIAMYIDVWLLNFRIKVRRYERPCVMPWHVCWNIPHAVLQWFLTRVVGSFCLQHLLPITWHLPGTLTMLRV